jgi:pyrimidine-specific ribonucleoside hydrolase
VEPVSWNTNRDPEAAHEVFSAGIQTYAIHLGNSQDLCFDNVFYADIERLSSPAAELVTQLHKSRRVRQLIDEEHFRCWDEAAVLALAVPSLIHLERMQTYPSAYIVSSWDQAAARRSYIDLLSGIHSKAPIPRAAVLLDHYPTDSLLLQRDVAARAVEIIHRHGLEEWKSALLASELHRHLGVYSILGVKMGIRAREILEASADELRVESWAGFEPPLSCMNDGLQVATGATLGRGTISVATDRSEPKALFMKGSKRLELHLREEVTARIRRDVRDALESHGNLTPAYWAKIRELALDYWLELDRREIFRETLTRQETSR